MKNRINKKLKEENLEFKVVDLVPAVGIITFLKRNKKKDFLTEENTVRGWKGFAWQMYQYGATTLIVAPPLVHYGLKALKYFAKKEWGIF